MPDKAFPMIANRRIDPPINVKKSNSSSKKSQAQSGPRITSVIDSRASSAAGTDFDPRV